MSAIKVGDYVEVKSWEELVNEFGTEDYEDSKVVPCSGYFTEDMKYLCGFKFEVEEIIGDNVKHLNGVIVQGTKMFIITPDMVKVISEEEYKEFIESDCDCPACSGEHCQSTETLEAEIIQELFNKTSELIEGASIEALEEFKNVLGKVEEQFSKLHILIDEEYKKRKEEENSISKEEKINKMIDLHERMMKFAEENNHKDFYVFDSDTGKWCIEYNAEDDKIEVNCYCEVYDLLSVYFSSEELANKAVKLFGKELLECVKLTQN